MTITYEKVDIEIINPPRAAGPLAKPCRKFRARPHPTIVIFWQGETELLLRSVGGSGSSVVRAGLIRLGDAADCPSSWFVASAAVNIHLKNWKQCCYVAVNTTEPVGAIEGWKPRLIACRAPYPTFR
jgi:hypothetical protein